MESSLQDKISIELAKWNRERTFPQVSYQTVPQNNGNTLIELSGYEHSLRTNPLLKALPVIILTSTGIDIYKIQIVKRTYFKYANIIQNAEEEVMGTENASVLELNSEKIKSLFEKIENYNKTWQHK